MYEQRPGLDMSESMDLERKGTTPKRKPSATFTDECIGLGDKRLKCEVQG